MAQKQPPYWFERVNPDIFKEEKYVTQAQTLLGLLHIKNERPITAQSLRLAALHTHMFVAWKRSGPGTTHRGLLVGMATLSVMYETDGPVGMVNEVVTLTGHRRKGVMRELMTRLIRAAKHYGLVELELTSNSSRKEAHALYESLGFVTRETNVFTMRLD